MLFKWFKSHVDTHILLSKPDADQKKQTNKQKIYRYTRNVSPLHSWWGRAPAPPMGQPPLEVSLCRTALRQRSGVAWGRRKSPDWCALQAVQRHLELLILIQQLLTSVLRKCAKSNLSYTDLGEGISPVCFEFLFRFILNARTEIILFQIGSMAMLIKCYLPLQMCFLFVYKLFYFRVYRPPLYVHSCVRRAQVSALFIYFLKLRSRVNWRDLFYLK